MRRLLACALVLTAVVSTATACSSGEDQGGGDLAQYCPLARDAQSRISTMSLAGPADQLQAQLGTIKTSLGQLLAVAPNRIKDDLANLSSVVDTYSAALQKAGGDVRNVDPKVVDDITPKVRKAGGAIARLNRDDCNIPFPTTAP